MHVDPIASTILALALILVVARIGAEIAGRLGQPAVLGELSAGVLLGNLGLVGVSGLEPLAHDPSLELLSGIGVLLLLFEVGLESTVAQMRKVGLTAVIVAVIGIVAPFGLGWLVAAWLAPHQGIYVHIFLAATLSATSVGITARVFQDLGRLQTPEAQVILGAAVLDDVLGLVVLAVVTGMIGAAAGGAQLSILSIVVICAKALGFLVAAILIGQLLAGPVFRTAARFRAGGMLLAFGLAFCFFFSWGAAVIGLAPIVGAFAAGLILEEAHSRPFHERGEPSLEKLVHPVAGFLVPVFFVLMGMRTDLSAFARTDVLGLAAGLTVAAIVGKQLCSLGAGGRVDRWTVGLGMVPRGEVGLIFAGIGSNLELGNSPVIDAASYSAVVVMVIVTTMVTPPALAARLRRLGRVPSEPATPAG